MEWVVMVGVDIVWFLTVRYLWTFRAEIMAGFKEAWRKTLDCFQKIAGG